MENDLIKPGEKIPGSIKIIRTDKKFDGDCRIETQCRSCGYGVALTTFEGMWNVLLFGRNDGNNPKYAFGPKYIQKYLEICFRNGPKPEPEIRSQIIKELIDENEKM